MNKFNFVVDKLPDTESLEPISSDAIFSLHINSSNDLKKIDLQRLHEEKIYLNALFRFSVFLNFNSGNSQNELLIEELLKNKALLLQLFFHPQFEKTNNKPVLFLSENCKNNITIDSFIKTINNYCFSQGFLGIESIYLSENYNFSDPASHVLHHFKDVNNLEERYYQLLTKDFYTARYVGLINSPPGTFKDTITAKIQSEKKLMENFPNQYFILKHYFQNTEQLAQLKDESKYLEENLANHKMYLEIFKSFDESKKINEFYYNEYEILPLWYKKFGHILKVIMGKRTFNSLFDNNVKKYKD